MPKVIGVFNTFKDLDLIPITDIAQWLGKLIISPQTIENYVGNLILYPQVAPIKPEDLKLDLAILREALKRNALFYQESQKKIIIPQEFVERFGGIKEIILAMLDVIKMPDVTQVVMAGDGREEVVGSTLTPKFTKKETEVELNIEEKLYKVKQGSLTVIPCLKGRCHLQFKSDDATILAKKDITVESYGGSLGIVVDAR